MPELPPPLQLVLRENCAQQPSHPLPVAAALLLVERLHRVGPPEGFVAVDDVRLEHAQPLDEAVLGGQALGQVPRFDIGLDDVAVLVGRGEAGLLEDAPAGPAAEDRALPQDEAALRFVEIGGDEAIMHLYTDAPTSESRDSLFTILFASITVAITKRHQYHTQRITADAARRTLGAALHLGLPWHFHSLVLYQNPNCARDVLTQLMLDLGVDREEKSLLLAVTADMLHVVAHYTQRLPDALEDIPCAIAAKVLPPMLREDDPAVQMTAIACVVSTVRHEHNQARHAEEAAAPAAKIDCLPLLQLVASGATITHRLAAVRTLERLAIVARTYPAISKTFSQLLHLILQKESYIPHLMVVYRACMSLMVKQLGDRGEGDISAQCLSGTLQSGQQGHGTEIIAAGHLWNLYFALRQADSMSSTPTVRSARHVLVFVLIPVDIKNAAASLITWTKVMEDSYPPCAIVGAQQVIRISGIAQYDRYDAAVNEAEQSQKAEVLKSAYHMASSIVYH